jgi:hypothetical protein
MLQLGENSLRFHVLNWPGGLPNPTGLIYDATITYDTEAVPGPAGIPIMIGGLVLALKRRKAKKQV